MSIVIQHSTPETLSDALRLAFSHFPQTEQTAYLEMFAGGMRRGDIPMEGLLEAWREGQLVGAVLWQQQPGKSALVWPPGIVLQEGEDTAIQLLGAVAVRLGALGVRLACVLLDHVADEDDRVLTSSRFQHLANLSYLVSSQEQFPTALPPSPLEFEAYRPEHHDRFAKLMEATYEGTLDCPGLEGLRAMEDVLAGYRGTGAFSPERWLIVRYKGQDIGCLLLADHPDQEQWELAYMGLVKGARGQGLGRKIVRHAQWLTQSAGRSRLVLAVDAANRPAAEVYTSSGFRQWARRSVYIRSFS
ncbi:MAG: GNAT family N-acetyltransferase [Thermoguttaceae bacterium]